VVTQYTERVCPSGSLTMQAVVETLMSFGLRHVVEFDGKITCKLWLTTLWVEDISGRYESERYFKWH
jgi:hypothetical protein